MGSMPHLVAAGRRCLTVNRGCFKPGKAQGSGWNPRRFWSILTLGVADFAGHAGARRGTPGHARARRGTPGRTGHAGANGACRGSTECDEITYRKFIIFLLEIPEILGTPGPTGHHGANRAPTSPGSSNGHNESVTAAGTGGLAGLDTTPEFLQYSPEHVHRRGCGTLSVIHPGSYIHVT